MQLGRDIPGLGRLRESKALLQLQERGRKGGIEAVVADVTAACATHSVSLVWLRLGLGAGCENAQVMWWWCIGGA